MEVLCETEFVQRRKIVWRKKAVFILQYISHSIIWPKLVHTTDCVVSDLRLRYLVSCVTMPLST